MLADSRVSCAVLSKRLIQRRTKGVPCSGHVLCYQILEQQTVTLIFDTIFEYFSQPKLNLNLKPRGLPTKPPQGLFTGSHPSMRQNPDTGRVGSKTSARIYSSQFRFFFRNSTSSQSLSLYYFVVFSKSNCK